MTTIPVSFETKGRFVRLLRGGETQDQLIQKMIEQYDPEQYDDPLEVDAGG